MLLGKHAFVVLLLVLVLSACSSKEPSGCSSVRPERFSESDLIGTWSALGSRGNSAITLRGDGRYKQTMNEDETGFTYEGDWKPWRVTYSDQGIPYLHLEGFLMCAYWTSMDCRTGTTNLTPVVVGDTKDPFTGEYYWYDGCQKKWVDTPGEGVFMVFRRKSPLPSQLRLVPFTKSSDTPTGPPFVLKEP